MRKRKKQLAYYMDLLKDNEILLLKSKDEYFKNHYIGSPLNILTNFSGSSAEAVVEKSGKITIFVDPRYHILVEKQVYPEIEIYKMDLGESFLDALKKCYKKDTILHTVSDISLKEYLELDSYFDLRSYRIEPKFYKNKEFNKRSHIFLVSNTIEPADFNFKIEKLKKYFLNIDRMLVFNLDQISYLTNLRSFQSKYLSNFRAILYLDFKNSNYILFSNKISKKIKIDNLIFKDIKDFSKFISNQNEEIYIEYDDVSLTNYLAVKKPKQNKTKNLPVIASLKSMSVINDMVDASNKLDKAIWNFKNQLKVGLSEEDLVEIFEKELLAAGLKHPSFKTILAINENTASIHYSTYDKNKILYDESLILLDCGGYSDSGHATDITRTLYFGSNPKPIYKKIYTYVLKAFINCYLSKDKEARYIDAQARRILNPLQEDGFYFNHGLGHGIGTSCHQNPPCLAMRSRDTIKPYQVHSIEPGLYGKSLDGDEFGVRIENCVYFDSSYNRYSLSEYFFEDILIDCNLLEDYEIEFIKNWQEKFYARIGNH